MIPFLWPWWTSYMSATPPLLEPLITWRSAPTLFKTNLCYSLLPEKETNWRLRKATKIGNFIREIPSPCLALTHSPGLFLHKMGFGIMFNDYLGRKKACLDYKNIDFRGLPHWIFSWFWSKIGIFLFVMRYQFGGVVQIKMNLILWNPYTVGLLELYITSRATCSLRM